MQLQPKMTPVAAILRASVPMWLLANVPAFFLLPAFVACISRLRIVPEEEPMARLFGAGFLAYKARMRRQP